MRLLFIVQLFLVIVSPLYATNPFFKPTDDADFRRGIEILDEYCVRCHMDLRLKGDINIEEALAHRPLVKQVDLWVNVLERVKNKEMPPKGKDQPTEEEFKFLENWLDQEINYFDYSLIKDPGFESIRRLTHYEYDNTIRDLFGVDLKPSKKFPPDLSGTSGFDNSSNTLFIESLLMEKYLFVAEEVVDLALPENPQTEQELASHELIFVKVPDDLVSETEAAEAIIKRFLRRAYRRPPSSDEIANMVKVFEQTRGSDISFHECIKKLLKVVLISPDFLFKTELARDTKEDYKLNSWEMANRLSYFLWGSMPDDELIVLSDQDQLTNPDVLYQQAERMLADDKADALGRTFAAQWLGFEALGVRIRLDPIANPWCTDTLMDAMKAETWLFVNDVFRKNRPLTELIDADYTFLNEELAGHYRITAEGLDGDKMVRVTLTDRNRGGIFGQGSLMAITSLGSRTSPVVRGTWVLDTILGTPPPPPPPNVSEFSDEVREQRRLTIREKMELHRKNPACFSCHSKIDPLGLSLENFDHFGRWRTVYRRGRTPIDATGTLPNGTNFEGPIGLKKVILEQRFDDFLRQMVRKMLSYALGRQLEYYDEPVIRHIVKSVKEDGFKSQTLMREVIMSYPFQYKRNRMIAGPDEKVAGVINTE